MFIIPSLESRTICYKYNETQMGCFLQNAKCFYPTCMTVPRTFSFCFIIQHSHQSQIQNICSIIAYYSFSQRIMNFRRKKIIFVHRQKFHRMPYLAPVAVTAYGRSSTSALMYCTGTDLF
jgi:hypothetical protein